MGRSKKYTHRYIHVYENTHRHPYLFGHTRIKSGSLIDKKRSNEIKMDYIEPIKSLHKIFIYVR